MQAHELALHNQYLEQGKPTLLQSPMYHMPTPFTASVKYVLTRCDHLFMFSEGQVKQGKTGAKMDFVYFPADLMDQEA